MRAEMDVRMFTGVRDRNKNPQPTGISSSETGEQATPE